MAMFSSSLYLDWTSAQVVIKTAVKFADCAEQNSHADPFQRSGLVKGLARETMWTEFAKDCVITLLVCWY